ncbi:HD domain-containing protein [Candidatus Saccharibacteria bacterium]|nr:HD domain-containing protein [Candidatus Saccharibacteria bacterium]
MMDAGELGIMKIPDVDTVAKMSEMEKDWLAYRMKCAESFVVRGGYVACKTSIPLSLDDIFSRPEYVAEHSGRVVLLTALALLKICPNVVDTLGFDCLLQALTHDIGEIRHGDQLDDGSIEHELFRERERKTREVFYACLPEKQAQKLREMSEQFETYQGYFGALIKAADKVDAVAWQLFLAEHYRIGNVLMKNPPSSADLKYAKLIGTHEAPDVWCTHYRDMTRNIDREIREFFDEFLEVAFSKVYGYIPRCMTISLEEIV